MCCPLGSQSEQHLRVVRLGQEEAESGPKLGVVGGGRVCGELGMESAGGGKAAQVFGICYLASSNEFLRYTTGKSKGCSGFK